MTLANRKRLAIHYEKLGLKKHPYVLEFKKKTSVELPGKTIQEVTEENEVQE